MPANFPGDIHERELCMMIGLTYGFLSYECFLHFFNDSEIDSKHAKIPMKIQTCLDFKNLMKKCKNQKSLSFVKWLCLEKRNLFGNDIHRLTLGLKNL
jgi:hypothetical protein